MDKNNKPTGIWIVCILNIVAGALMVFASLGVETGSEGAIIFAGGAFSLVVAFGLLGLKSWARNLAIGGYILNVIFCLTESNIVGVVVASIILMYFFSDTVTTAFGKMPETEVIPQAVVPQKEVKSQSMFDSFMPPRI